ncbi:MAG: thioredoxin [Candidatus Latescibacteria bacterium]|jgi:thioredoxin 1|nr:thioredoxin [Candidatus Latescibacterota bacterium]
MAKPIVVTDDTFQSTVLENSLPVIVDFWAEWCPPCKMISPILEQIAEEYDGKAAVCKVNVDENQELARKYEVRSIPTLLFMKDGEIKEQVVGALPKDQLESRLNALL